MRLILIAAVTALTAGATASAAWAQAGKSEMNQIVDKSESLYKPGESKPAAPAQPAASAPAQVQPAASAPAQPAASTTTAQPATTPPAANADANKQGGDIKESTGRTVSPETTGQQQPQGPTGPIETESGGAPAESPQGQTPPGMQAAPEGSSKTTVEPEPDRK
jgi:hypothetical protein